MFIDTHCHFNHSQFADDSESSIQRALAAGVDRMIVVGFDVESSERAVRLAEEHSCLYAAVGIHPHEADIWSTEIEARLSGWLNHPRVVALGEIGLDYYRNLSPRDRQVTAFVAQMELAADAGMPIIIHCRDAYQDLLDLMDASSSSSHTGVMHCWAGSVQDARRTVSLGLYLGIGGTVTYNKSDEIRVAVKEAPIERLLLETDSPYLSPVPLRGKRNEPANLSLVVSQIATLRGMSEQEVGIATTSNALTCFPRISR